MKLVATLAIVWISLHGYLFGQTGSADSQRQSGMTAVNGEFVGMEEIKNYEPGKEWFHENNLFINNNEALLDKVPLEIVKGRKVYSASDGGFITYRGRFFQQGKQLFISLRPFESDDIIFPTGSEPYSKVTVFPVKIMSHGIEIDDVLYRSTNLSEEKRIQLVIRLKMEPMEYTGSRPYAPHLAPRPPCN